MSTNPLESSFSLTFAEYSAEAGTTRVYPGSGEGMGLSYAVMGLAGEAGELANQAKKVLRDDGGELTPERREKMAAELGDVLWYVAAVAHELGVDLEDAARHNLQKLRARADRGTLRGDGDVR